MSGPSQDWTPDRVKAAVYERGISMEALAIQHGYSAAVVRIALIRRCAAGEKLVSHLIGVPLQEIWPSRYFPDGRSRAIPRRSRLINQSHTAPARQNRVAR